MPLTGASGIGEKPLEFRLQFRKGVPNLIHAGAVARSAAFVVTMFAREKPFGRLAFFKKALGLFYGLRECCHVVVSC
jgi:hypothetical protein